MTSPEAALSGSGSEGQTVETSAGEGVLSVVARKEVFNAPPVSCTALVVATR